jgi:pimeloyl-ACP methyl ester carboxylesterase
VLNMKMVLLVVLLVHSSHALQKSQTIEVGAIEGSSFRIDMPAEWNHELVLFLHGYTMGPVRFDREPLNPTMQSFVDKGYALAQPGYSAGGWAAREATTAALGLREYFLRKHSKPTRVYLAGESFGGFITTVLIERYPQLFDGGLALCAPLGSADWFMSRRVFDGRVVFDYYYPGLLPPADSMAEGYRVQPDGVKAIEDRMDQTPTDAGLVKRYLGVKTNSEAAFVAAFFTQILQDDIRRSGGSPFDNTTILYRIAPDQNDSGLNGGVKRYRGTANAQKYLQQYFRVSGRLRRPLVSLQTIYDPLIPEWLTNSYTTLVQRAGHPELFHQYFVPKSGHCGFDPSDVESGFAHLLSQAATNRKTANAAVVRNVVQHQISRGLDVGQR